MAFSSSPIGVSLQRALDVHIRHLHCLHRLHQPMVSYIPNRATGGVTLVSVFNLPITTVTAEFSGPLSGWVRFGTSVASRYPLGIKSGNGESITNRGYPQNFEQSKLHLTITSNFTHRTLPASARNTPNSTVLRFSTASARAFIRRLSSSTFASRLLISSVETVEHPPVPRTCSQNCLGGSRLLDLELWGC